MNNAGSREEEKQGYITRNSLGCLVGKAPLYQWKVPALSDTDYRRQPPASQKTLPPPPPRALSDGKTENLKETCQVSGCDSLGCSCLPPFGESCSALWNGKAVPWRVSHSFILAICGVFGIQFRSKYWNSWQFLKPTLPTAVLTQELPLHKHPDGSRPTLERCFACRMKTKCVNVNLSFTLDTQNEQTQVLASCQRLQIQQSRIFYREFHFLSFQLPGQGGDAMCACTLPAPPVAFNSQRVQGDRDPGLCHPT